MEKQGSPTVHSTRGYEDHRDLVIGVTNQAGAAIVSQYDYGYDPAGMRTSVVNQGSAFQDAALNLWEYNDRYELTLSDRREGADPGDPGDRIGAEYRAYVYDPIGNRTSAQAGWGTTPTSYDDEQTDGTNSLNQYLETANPTEVFAYELDGKASDAVKATYVWGLDLSGSFEGAGGIGGLLMAESRAAYSNQTVAFFHDGNGNVTQLIELPGGATTAHYEYDPYGNPIAAPANHWNP